MQFPLIFLSPSSVSSKTSNGVETRKCPNYLPIFSPSHASPSLPLSLSFSSSLISSPGSPEFPFRSTLPEVYKGLACCFFSGFVKIGWQHRSPTPSTINKTSKTNVFYVLRWTTEKKKHVQD